MKWIKRFALPLLTLLVITAGAALPMIVSQVQDNRIREHREEFVLNTVNLTLQQDVDVSVALRLIAEDYTTIPWEEETEMAAQDAANAAKSVISEMAAYDLLAVEDVGILESAEPELLISADGSNSALVWSCIWRGGKISPCFVLLDDSTGKAVQFLVSSPTLQNTEQAHAQLAKWNAFFLDCYGIEIISVAEESQYLSNGVSIYQFFLGVDLRDGLEPCKLELRIYDGMAALLPGAQ